jgi:hypothetical protein
MSLFTPEQFDQLRQRATLREVVAGVDVQIRATRPSKSDIRRGNRYYRLLKHNEHRWAHRFAYKHDTGDATANLIVAMLKAGTLQLDMSVRLAVRNPAVGDLELQRLIERANL